MKELILEIPSWIGETEARDDLIEWEAYFRAHEEWTKKYKELQNVWSNNQDS